MLELRWYKSVDDAIFRLQYRENISTIEDGYRTWNYGKWVDVPYELEGPQNENLKLAGE